MLQSTLPSSLKFNPIEFDPFADGELVMAIPATASQQEIWLAVQMGREANLAYNESVSLRLRGSLNIEALRSSLQALVQRHEALRTTFSPDGVTLCVAASMLINTPLIDLSMVDSEDDRTAKLKDIIHQDVAENAFDVAHDCLVRAQIVRISDQEHVLILTAHHIVCDGWSWGVLLPELATLYSAAQQGTTAVLDAPQQFSDYAALQADLPTTQDYAEAERYWLQQFSGQIPVLDLPLDRPRPSFRTYAADREDWVVQPSLVTDLKKVATKAGCSFFTLLLTAFEVFLHRLSGQSDIVIGVPSAGQLFTDFDQLVGHCVNFLPIRSQIDSAQPFVDYMRARNPQILEVYDYQHLSFGDLIKKLPLPRDFSRVPLAPVSFNLDRPLTGKDLPFEGLEVEISSNARDYEAFELFLNVCEVDGGMVLECQYNTDLFEPDTIRCRLQEFETLLAGIAANPQQPVAALPILSPAEQQKILVDWNATDVEYPKHLRMHDLFEAQVEKTPTATAVIFDGQTLSYQALNQRANQLAHRLQRLGVQPEITVGICIERSLEMVIALLAILKAGGGYVPLDPTYPQDRLAHILSDAQLAAVLTQDKFRSLVPEQGIPVLCIDTTWDEIAIESQENPSSPVTSENLAYIIYTSGSTGKPKGVLIEHRGAVNTLLDINSRFQVVPGDRLLAVCSLNFDLSVYDIFGLLAAGATIILPQPAIAPDLNNWINLMEQEQVTLWNTAPPVMQMFSGYLMDQKRTLPASLRLVMLSGDWIPLGLPDQIRQIRPGNQPLEIISLGGATEASIWSILYPIDAVDPSWKSIPYGYPMFNQQFYVLNELLCPVPVGQIGELYIGGDGVARGYHNRPDLNATKFLPDPFRPQPRAQIYRTGDLGRYRKDGTIEFLGRVDFQVKVRGYRIELGEIESVLVQHPQVQQAMVIVREDTPGDKRIVAYMVALDNQPPTVNDLRALLKENLPEYMVPSVFMFLDALPLTPNGKVDRKALPVPDQGGVQTAQETFIAPRDDLDVQLIKLWEKVLNVSPVKMQDNFFELGGHSLLAVSLIAQLEKTYGKELPLSVLFRSPTVETLANTLREEGFQSSSQSLVTIQKGDSSKPPLFCIYGIVLYYDLARHLGADQPVYGIYLREEVDIVQSKLLPDKNPDSLSNKFMTVTDLATRYLQEIQKHQPVGPYFLAGESLGGVVAFEMAQQLHLQGEKVALLCLLDSTIPGKDKPSLKQRLAFHGKNVVQQGLPYLLNRAKTKISQAKAKTSGMAIQSDFQEYAFKTYRLQPYPGKAVLFRAMDESHFESLQEWYELALGGLEVHDVPGDHLGILHEPHVQILAKKLNTCIDQALQTI